MTLSNSWKGAYAELGSFIARNPGIKISANSIDIPGDIRPDFYNLFGTVRLAFLEEKFPSLLDEARTFSQSFISVEREVTKLLGLADISVPTHLKQFLYEPINYLKGRLWNLLFHLLKGKIETGIFEQEASVIIEESFRSYYRLAYKKWVALTLVKLLASDKAFSITPPEVETKDDDIQVDIRKVPDPIESNHLSFNDEEVFSLVVPDFIVHSAKINRYVAITTEIVRAVYKATDITEKREWFSINNIGINYNGEVLLKPDLTICIDDNAKDICLIADMDRICRPDLIIESVVQKSWLDKMGLYRIKLCHDTFKPKLGTYVVSKEPLSGEVIKEFASQQATQKSTGEPVSEELHALTVGLNQSLLAPIINVLMNSKNQDSK
jgi:hypothetical protein